MSWLLALKSSKVWGLDLRSLALCRIATGLVIVGDLIGRAESFRIHYTDDGILPRQVLYDIDALRFPSIYAMSGWDLYIAFLFVVHGLVGLALALGYRTRLSGFLAWYMTVSLQERLFMANNGGDKVLASLLFWGMFLPWGEVLSVDAVGRRAESAGADEGQQERGVCNAASAMILLQPIMIYWVSVFHKLEPTWLRGEVLSYALQSDFYARPVAFLLLPYPLLLKCLAYLTLGWELIGPLCLLSTRPGIRAFGCAAFMLMHLCFGVFLRIGVFSFSPLLYMLALLPSATWHLPLFRKNQTRFEDLLARLKLSPPLAKPVILGRRAQAALVALFVYVTLIALSQDKRLGRLTPESLDCVANLTGLYQRWSVFVDVPHIFDGWLVVEAKLADGREVDLFQGYEPARWDKPSTPYHRYDSFRWPTPLVVITGDARYQRWFVRALALDWQRDHPKDQVVWASLMLFSESPRIDYRAAPVERTTLWEGYPK